MLIRGRVRLTRWHADDAPVATTDDACTARLGDEALAVHNDERRWPPRVPRGRSRDLTVAIAPCRAAPCRAATGDRG